MRRMYRDLERMAEREGEAVFRLCYVLTGRVRTAERAAFQAFLYLAEEPEGLDDGEARRRLYRWALRAAEDEKYRRSSSPLRRGALEEELGRRIDDALWRFLRRSMKRKAGCWLVWAGGFSPRSAADVLRLRPRRLEKYLAASEERDALLAEGALPAPSGAWASQLPDDLLLHWQERNVPLENRLLRIRSAADRLVPILALAAALLCASAVWYAGRVG